MPTAFFATLLNCYVLLAKCFLLSLFVVQLFDQLRKWNFFCILECLKCGFLLYQAQQPGALFEEKPQSANDAWRKLHSDPLLLIRQREQEALACVKNNPVQIAMIRKSVSTLYIG